MSTRLEVFRTLDDHAWCLSCPQCADYWYADDWTDAMQYARDHVGWHRARYCEKCGRP